MSFNDLNNKLANVKYVINLHYYKNNSLETHRINKALASCCQVISIVSADHYLNEKYNWNLPEGDYETLGGMLIHLYEDIPAVNEVITLSAFQFQIMTVTDARIDTIKVIISGKPISK